MKLKEFIKQHENDDIELKEDGTLKILENKVKLEKYIPKNGEYYYCIDSYGYVWSTQKNCEGDEYLINHRLVFKTQEEAEDYKYFLDKLDEYSYKFSDEEWENEDLKKFYIHYNYKCHTNNVVYTIWVKRYKHYFYSRCDAQKFIDEVGENRINAYMFDVWE